MIWVQRTEQSYHEWQEAEQKWDGRSIFISILSYTWAALPTFFPYARKQAYLNHFAWGRVCGQHRSEKTWSTAYSDSKFSWLLWSAPICFHLWKLELLLWHVGVMIYLSRQSLTRTWLEEGGKLRFTYIYSSLIKEGNRFMDKCLAIAIRVLRGWHIILHEPEIEFWVFETPNWLR